MMQRYGSYPRYRLLVTYFIEKKCWSASPFISPYHCMTRRFCVRVVAGTPDRGVWRREILWYFSGLRGQRRIDLGGPGDDAAFGTLRGDACQAGEARGFAAAARRTAASPQAAAAGHPDAIATLMRRTLMRTRAPILSSLRRMVPQVALAYSVSWSPMRRKAQSST